MAKEQLQKLNDLADKKSALTDAVSKVVSQNERLKSNVDAELGQGGFIIVPPKKKVQPHMPLEQMTDIARFNLRNTPEKVDEKKEVLKTMIDDDTRRRQSEIEEVDRELEEFAPVYVAILNALTDEVTGQAEQFVLGKLTEDELRATKDTFDDVASLPDRLPPLKRGLERLESQSNVVESVDPAVQQDAPTDPTPPADTPPAYTSDRASTLRPARFPTPWLDTYHWGDDPDFDIEPGRTKSKRKSGPKKATEEKPFTPKTEDVFEFPDGTQIKGHKAHLAKVLTEKLSNPMLYMTADDLTIELYGDADRKNKQSMTANLAQLKRLLLEKMEIEVNSTFDPRNQNQEVRYWAKRIGDRTPEALVATLHVLPTPKDLLPPETPVETSPEAETTATIEDEGLNDIPSIEEATLLAGYFKLHERTFEEIGINLPSDNLMDKLVYTLGDKNGRTEEDIRELRLSGIRKVKQLIADEQLTTVLDALDTTDPRLDFLRYIKDFESLQIEYQRAGSTLYHVISVVNLLDLMINSQIDLSTTTNIRSYTAAEEKDDNKAASDGTPTDADTVLEAAPPAPDTAIEEDGATLPAIDEGAEEFESTGEITVFQPDEEEPVVELKEIENQFTGIREKISGVVDLVLGHSELNKGLRRRDFSKYFLGLRQKDIKRAISQGYVDEEVTVIEKGRRIKSDRLSPEAVATLACLKQLPQGLPPHLKLEIRELVSEEFERRSMELLAEEIEVTPDPQEESLAEDSGGEVDRVWIEHYKEAIKRFRLEELGGLDPNGVHPRVAQRRFPFMKQSFIRNAFERNVLPKNSLKSRGGGVLLTHEAITRLYFDKIATEGGMSRPEKLGLERAIREYRREIEREASEKATRGDEDKFIEG